MLNAICRRFGGGPVGLSTLAISVAEETETVEHLPSYGNRTRKISSNT